MEQVDNKQYQIFISYRRNGSDAHARILYEKLKDMGYSVFLDFESLFSGGFKGNIMKAIEGCRDYILLLPQGGLDRCKDEEDVLREEIKTAIKFDKNIIPVFISGFKMPPKDQLPEDISFISERHGIDCSMEYFDAVFEKILRYLDSEPQDKMVFDSIRRIKDRMIGLPHEYFKKWACMKLNSFLTENDDFLDGTNWTNPHSEDTFGVAGIEFTTNNIKAITAVNDYWEDNFTIEYLKKQGEMIKNGIKIYRVFVLEKDGYENAKPQMKYQLDLGINVYYIFKDNQYIDPEWLEEDYLIQDDKLLVQIFCKSHRYEMQNTNEEMITSDAVKVNYKIERYERIIERANRFEG